MSRSGYSDDCEDQWGLIRWRGAVNSAINGKRGQAFLREALAALDAMPEKRLVTDELQADGDFCTLGVVGAARGLQLEKIDTEDWQQLSHEFGISEALAREIMFENDQTFQDHMDKYVVICGPMRPHYPDWGKHERRFIVDNPRAPELRWNRMRAWIQKHIKEAQS